MAAPEPRDLAVTTKRWLAPRYWQRLCRRCNVSSDACGASAWQVAGLAGSKLRDYQQRMDTEGYFCLDASADLSDADRGRYAAAVSALAGAVETLVAHGWPASFVSVFDEAWEVAHMLSAVMRCTTGGNENMQDLVAWHVDASKHQAGFSPHRDRHLGAREQHSHHVAATFRGPNGTAPKYATCWIALSDAAPENGCLYVIDRETDTAYAHGDCSPAASRLRKEGVGAGGSAGKGGGGGFALGAVAQGPPAYLPVSVCLSACRVTCVTHISGGCCPGPACVLAGVREGESVCLSVCLSACLSVRLPVCPSCCVCTHLSPHRSTQTHTHTHIIIIIIIIIIMCVDNTFMCVDLCGLMCITRVHMCAYA